MCTSFQYKVWKLFSKNEAQGSPTGRESHVRIRVSFSYDLTGVGSFGVSSAVFPEPVMNMAQTHAPFFADSINEL